MTDGHEQGSPEGADVSMTTLADRHVRVRRQRAQVESLVAFLHAKQDAARYAPFDDADRELATRSIVKMRDDVGIASCFARPWQPMPPTPEFFQLVMHDLVSTLPASKTIAPTDAWIGRLDAVRDGLIDLDRTLE